MLHAPDQNDVQDVPQEDGTMLESIIAIPGALAAALEAFARFPIHALGLFDDTAEK